MKLYRKVWKLEEVKTKLEISLMEKFVALIPLRLKNSTMTELEILFPR